MPICLTCPVCAAQMSVADEHVGRQVRCPTCAAITIATEPILDVLPVDVLEVVEADAGACPHCGRAVVPRPTRKRKCPHCAGTVVIRQDMPMTEAQAAVFDARRSDYSQQKARREKAARYAGERRQTALRNFQQAKRSGEQGIIAAVEILIVDDGDCCDFCRSRNGLRIPIRTCTVDMVPPFHGCSNTDDGCRCCFTTILARGYR